MFPGVLTGSDLGDLKAVGGTLTSTLQLCHKTVFVNMSISVMDVSFKCIKVLREYKQCVYTVPCAAKCLTLCPPSLYY